MSICSNTRITDPETLERRFDVLLRRFELRQGSGGNGRFRGGDGLVREVEFLADMTGESESTRPRLLLDFIPNSKLKISKLKISTLLQKFNSKL